MAAIGLRSDATVSSGPPDSGFDRKTSAAAGLFDLARVALLAESPAEKLLLTEQLARQWRRRTVGLHEQGRYAPPEWPGRPAAPALVAPRALPARHLKTVEGKAAFIHALAHIEFNAINLAWDAVYRFRDLPESFYDDWVAVADDEARHFSLLNQRLAESGFTYGDFPAHDGLWQMAQKTAHDLLLRMALVPRVLEARGLDVTPGMITRFRGAGDVETSEVLALILGEEVAHVAAGSRWFDYVCQQRGLAPGATYLALLEEHIPGMVRGPFNTEARLAAGFSEEELRLLAGN